MKREEHYCDRCGTQMSKLDSSGDNNVYGLSVKGYAPERTTASAALVIDTNTENGCGSTMKRFELSGTEFCGTKCFTEAMIKLLSSVNPNIVINVDV